MKKVMRKMECARRRNVKEKEKLKGKIISK
jgi:hypothetical protein